MSTLIPTVTISTVTPTVTVSTLTPTGTSSTLTPTVTVSTLIPTVTASTLTPTISVSTLTPTVTASTLTATITALTLITTLSMPIFTPPPIMCLHSPTQLTANAAGVSTMWTLPLLCVMSPPSFLSSVQVRHHRCVQCPLPTSATSCASMSTTTAASPCLYACLLQSVASSIAQPTAGRTHTLACPATRSCPVCHPP